MKYLFAFLVLLSVAAASQAQCYSRPYYSYTPVYKEIVVVKEVPLYVAAFVPVVSVGYVPQVGVPAVSAPTAAAAPVDPCADLRARFLALEKTVKGMSQPAPDTQPQQAQSKTVAGPQGGAGAILLGKCAECHTEGKSPKGGLILATADGRVAPLNAEQIKKILASTKGTQGKPPSMPKGKPALKDDEFAALLDLVD